MLRTELVTKSVGISTKIIACTHSH